MGENNSPNLVVKLTPQSFRDAGGLDVFPNLEIGDVIRVTSEKVGIENGPLFDSANGGLKERAEELGGTHVFGINYEFVRSGNSGYNCCVALGTCYKPR